MFTKQGFVIAILLMLSACQPLTKMKEENIISAVGMASISAQQGATQEEKETRAMRASKVDAYKELSEQVYGLRVSSRSSVNDQSLGRDNTQGAVDGIIRGAEVVASYKVGDSYVTELELDLDTMQKMKRYGESQPVPSNNNIIF
ncbi:flagellar biosynthesis protein FlgP [Salinivibrio kushneri]|uniref:Flagellar biosynthesis protein FlgP n=1 Tax=Salinivibrio kushneri TaxID=1908198 RepID=A0AB36JUZ4_9GAMM|nr:LPP20 family lipoprotein [Salinivibrio kushneri]OOE37343.1 flagellar biosynthesis protein FlgP [Salinivibrio kushneri]OOE39462.1 flagellar biosynthesis protein FlgP [Salinivibrio kushneri]QCP02682.1 flagellar biosynthesis protein FlgP [Salinivibrio kushneri]